MASEKYPRSSIEDDFNYGTNVASASVQIRMDFLRKVYTVLSLQIILTTATSALFMFCDTIKDFVHARYTYSSFMSCSTSAAQIPPALVLVSAVGSLGLIFALAIYRHQHPINLYLLFAFVMTFYEYSVVLQAFGLTAAVFMGLTAYTFQSKRDFSKLGAGLFACLWILIIASFMRVSREALYLASLFFHNDTVELVFSGVGALLFCGFIIYDTHLLMHQLSPEEHILASINLYLDIVNLFLHILRILDSMKKN
ncbi:hypothetical protein JZ751_005522 [Albula glossodonta]|uniref:Transmembrane BAX inhibitor motif-containing protein 4 n=1 Tax=Albula glossodonta TaxID=121402 RepID=A0A8T2N5A2_9TELE|nr:hypothetical protein JZ751_005522 [Albula glossodonta]